MKLFTNFFMYLLIGFAAYFLGSIFSKRFPIAFKLFFVAAAGSTLVSYSIVLLGAGHGVLPHWMKTISVVMHWIDLASLVLLGYGLGYLAGESPSGNAGFLMRGLSIQLGIAFIGSALEQYNDMVAIRKFFLDSGYTVWFMYVIFCIQFVFGLLLLFPLRSAMKLPIAGLLLAVMAGAVVTHFRRGDPFNYAIAAIEMALKCLILPGLLLIYPAYSTSYRSRGKVIPE